MAITEKIVTRSWHDDGAAKPRRTSSSERRLRSSAHELPLHVAPAGISGGNITGEAKTVDEFMRGGPSGGRRGNEGWVRVRSPVASYQSKRNDSRTNRSEVNILLLCRKPRGDSFHETSGRSKTISASGHDRVKRSSAIKLQIGPIRGSNVAILQQNQFSRQPWPNISLRGHHSMMAEPAQECSATIQPITSPSEPGHDDPPARPGN